MSYDQRIRVSRPGTWRLDRVKTLLGVKTSDSLPDPDRESRIRKYTKRAARGLPLFGDDDG